MPGWNVLVVDGNENDWFSIIEARSILEAVERLREFFPLIERWDEIRILQITEAPARLPE